jgi:hypothetical protein
MWLFVKDHYFQSFDAFGIMSMKYFLCRIFLQPYTYAWLRVGRSKVGDKS